MRIPAAIFVVILGASAAVAQGDTRGDYGPVEKPAAAAETKSEAKTEAKPAPKVEAKPQAKADAKPTPKAKIAKKEKPEPKPDSKATTGSAPANAPPAKPSGLQDAYAAIPRADRFEIQSDLTWGGDFTGPIDGEFSERLVAAVKAYQTRHKGAATGVLSADERATLSNAVEPRKQQVGWRLTEDPVTGARIGLPGRFATKSSALQNGTRWSSEQSQLQIETFKIDTGATLEAVFDQQKKLPRRRLESSSLQGDSFAITGMQGLKKMVVRGFARNGEVRGITILYDQAMEGTVDPLVAPISSAYVPFPAGFALAGASGTQRRKVEYGTGVIVSATGHVLTDRRLTADCNVIALPGLGNAERVATDGSGQLALLRLYGAKNLTPIGMIGGTAPGDAGVTLVGVADPTAQSGGAVASSVPARVRTSGSTRPLDTLPSPGFDGAAALDAQGRFSGLVVLQAPVVAGPNIAPQAVVISVDRIRDFLESNYVSPASGGVGAEAAKSAVTRVICIRN
jgi:peptidoglycan hydrolase-like protein with peptidoglycan-binding domain